MKDFNSLSSFYFNLKKLRQLIIIGNGFDLAHKLKTKYSNFIEWYLDSALDGFLKNNFYEDELIEIRLDYSTSIMSELRQLQNKEGDYFTLLINGIKYKQSYSIFIKSLLRKLQGDSNWIDIENSYYLNLKKIYNDFQPYENEHSQVNFNRRLDDINNTLRFLKIKLAEYLSYVSEQNIKKGKEQSIIDHFNKIVSQSTSSYMGLTTVGMESILNNDILVLNFNYTRTIEKYESECFRNQKYRVINIHGSLNNVEEMIFGYGDEMDEYYSKFENLNNNKLLEHFKSFGYLLNSKYQDFDNFLKTDQEFTVHIMGHSCGLSDRVLLNSIFENPNCKKISIYYYKKSENKNDNNYNELTREISRHFSGSNKAIMRTRITPFDKSLPLS